MTPRRWIVRVGLWGLGLAAAGFVVALSGIVPIAASSGHFAVTEWMLQLGKRRSIATHTIGLELPPLREPWQVMKGAGHYETACRPCHGGPDRARPRIAGAMLPPPPDLKAVVAERDPEALYYVVKHGIKFTGMPAWPTQRRDDEVQAMVAFLLALPALDGETYRRLVHGDTRANGALGSIGDLAGDVIARCARCHGHDGRGRGNAAFPKLAGQRRDYLLGALEAYDRETRHSGIMGPVVEALTTREQHALADYYARLPAAPATTGGPRDDRFTRGEAIATAGIPAREVPACTDCHGPGEGRRNSAYPKLAGQYADYLVLQLELFKRGDRGGSRYAHLMHRVAKRLTAEEMRSVAAYFAALEE